MISGFLGNPPNLLQGESTISVWTEGPLFERFRHIGQCPVQRPQAFDLIGFGDLDADGDSDLVYVEQSFVVLPNGDPASVIGVQLNGPDNGAQACCASEQSARVMLPRPPGTMEQTAAATGSPSLRP